MYLVNVQSEVYLVVQNPVAGWSHFCIHMTQLPYLHPFDFASRTCCLPVDLPAAVLLSLEYEKTEVECLEVDLLKMVFSFICPLF